MSRSGIVNVRMVITEEKILSNIAKVQRLIDPNSKKQIVQLEDDAFFKDLVESIKEMSDDFTEDILDTLGVIGRSKSDKSQNYQDALKLINARIANLESNLHIEIDMERIEDKSKALSYIGIEVADALKLIPAPQEDVEEVVEEKIETVEQPKAQILQQAQPVEQDTQYYESTRVEVKPSLWQRFKQSKFVRTIKYIMKIKVVLDIPALPSADEDRR